MRLRRQGAQGHTGAVEALQDRRDRFHLVERNGLRARLQPQKIADARHRPLVHQRRELLVLPVVARHHGRLQHRDDVRVVHVVLAVMHVFEQTTLLHAFRGVPGALRQVLRVGLQVGEIRALNAAVRAFETERYHVLAQAHDLEQLRAAVARDGGDPHLGHDLEQSLANAAAIAAAQFLARVRIHFHRALAHEIEQRLVRQIRIHGRGAIADETREMVGVARRAGLDQDVALAAQPRLDQAMMHGAGGEQRLNRNLAPDEVAVRQEQHQLPGAHRRFRPLAHLEDGGLEVHPFVILQIDELVRHARIFEAHDLAQFSLRQNG